jgi:hypothetical protein
VPDPITDALARIVGPGGFVIVTDKSRENLHTQFVTGEGSPALTAELVGNKYLPADERLTPLQMSDLRERGWDGDGEENWSREWGDASTEEARVQIALDALGALRDVFGASGDVVVEVHVEGPYQSTELVQGRARIALLAAVAIGFIAFVVAIVVSAINSP